MLDRGLWTRAIVKVGTGRGFVVGTRERLIITAAHCLPCLPPVGAGADDSRYSDLLGPLDGELTVCAECRFVDPVADIAVLGCLDRADLPEGAKLFDALIDVATVLPVAGVPLSPMKLNIQGRSVDGPLEGRCRGWMLSLAGQWFSCKVVATPRWLRFKEAAEGVVQGMSGSPIVNDNGEAIGMFAVSTGSTLGGHTAGGPNPHLLCALPGWFSGRVSSGP